MRYGIDLGGTKTEIIALDMGGAERLRRRINTPRGTYDGIVRGLIGLVESAERETGVKGTLGLGIPGAMSPATGLVKNANTTELIGHALDRDMSQALGRPVRIENDANCFTLSEASDGAGQGADVVFGVILGTGVGGGIVAHGRVLRGRHAIAGEWGHNPLPYADAGEMATARPCYCGRMGCIETWISGTGLAADYRFRGGAAADGRMVMEKVEQSEVLAVATFEAYAERLARALAAIVNVLDPDAIVLGGGMGQVKLLYDLLPEMMRPHVFSDVFETPIRPPVHGDSSGVRGAAWLGGQT